MKLSRGFLAFAGVSLVVIIGLIALYSSVCQQMGNPPTAPIYPGATFITKDATLGDYPHAEEYYTSADLPERVVEFYETNAVCYKISEGTACMANATPFGKYTVYINEQSYLSRRVTAFTIHFDWASCLGE